MDGWMEARMQINNNNNKHEYVWMDDSKLLQESNLTARPPRRAPITLYNSFNNRCRLANEGLVNLIGNTGSASTTHQLPRCYHYSMATPRMVKWMEWLIPFTYHIDLFLKIFEVFFLVLFPFFGLLPIGSTFFGDPIVLNWWCIESIVRLGIILKKNDRALLNEG